MKKELQRIIDHFYIDKGTGELDIENYGVYRMGLTGEEIRVYIQARAKRIGVSDLVKKFHDIAGCNTMAVSPTGEGLMYRWDVKRYADVLFRKTRQCDLVWD